jgi:hypothetical protein
MAEALLQLGQLDGIRKIKMMVTPDGHSRLELSRFLTPPVIADHRNAPVTESGNRFNVTLDGCCDHRAIPADEALHRNAAENLNRADALLFGRVTYEMMECLLVKHTSDQF